MIKSDELAAQIEPFDSFWEGPENIEKGYQKFKQFYKFNYFKAVPKNRDARILAISCGPGYFLNLLKEAGYTDVLGIDSRSSQIHWAQKKQLPAQQARAFEFLHDQADESYDCIFCEQELNHLTKPEIMAFIALARQKLKQGGKLICHALNGANPITGSEALAQNFDHYNTFTEYTLTQVMEHCGFTEAKVYPLNLYVFWGNPANYVLWAAAQCLTLLFRACFILYGKSNKLFTKKIAVVCTKP